MDQLDRRMGRPDVMEKRKNLALARNRTPAIQTAAQHYTYKSILALHQTIYENNKSIHTFSLGRTFQVHLLYDHHIFRAQ
jgi:hypothetical protein